MSQDPAPPPIILAIPALAPPTNPSSLSPNRDPATRFSVQPSSPPDQACLSPVLAPPSPVLSGSATASSAPPATQAQHSVLSRPDLPPDLLCFQSFLPPSCLVEPSPVQRFSASPELPPAAPELPPAAQTDSEARPPHSANHPPSSSLLHPLADARVSALPAVPLHCTQPVRRNASASSGSELTPAMPSESTVLPPPAFPPLSNSLPISPQQAEAPLSAQHADLQKRLPPVRRNAQVNHPHLKSYAQAAKGTPGPGFVRAHARDVESFARLPRTGINVIRGSRDGIPTFSVVQSDMTKVEDLYAKALVMKFHGGRPSLAASHKEISSWGLESPFSIGPLTSRSFLLRFQDERDLLKTLTRPYSTLINFPYKIFRWHNRCHIKEDSCMVPIWISLPGLPLQGFAPEFLESIGNTVGRFLCLDKATATLARPSEARMCIELDLTKERLQFILIDLFEGVKQPIVYERVPKFCMGCHMQGHTYVECSKNTLDTLQSKDSGPFPANQERSQAVRRNAKESSTPVSHVTPDQSRDSAFAAVTALLSASDLPHQDPPRSPSAAASSEHQLGDPLPHPPPPSQPPLPAAAQQLPAVQPLLQSSVAAATHPSSVAAATHQLCDPLPHPPPPSQPLLPAAAQSLPAVQPLPHPPSPSQPELPAAAQQLPAVQPILQSSDAAATHQPVTPSPSNVEEFSPSSPCPVTAAPHNAQDPAADFSPSQVLSAQAAPFSPSEPVQSSQNSTALINQHSTSSLGFFYNKHGAKCMNMPSREMVERQLGNQGHLSSLIKAPTPSKFPLQNHHFEGFESEGSFETDSQQNSPSGSPLKEVNQCIFPPQVSEGEDLTEDHPGFQGHNSDVDFYHRPRSSKKNKRQPDGPLRIQLRARKGLSSRK